MIYHLRLFKPPDLNVFKETYCVLPPIIVYYLIHSSCQSLGAGILLILPFTDKEEQTQRLEVLPLTTEVLAVVDLTLPEFCPYLTPSHLPSV